MANNATQQPLLLAIKDVAAALSISKRHVFRLIEQGALRRVHIGKSVRVVYSEVVKLARGGTR